MDEEKIKSWIEKKKDEGYSEEEIIESLKKKDYSEEKIKDYLEKTKSESNNKPWYKTHKIVIPIISIFLIILLSSTIYSAYKINSLQEDLQEQREEFQSSVKSLGEDINDTKEETRKALSNIKSDIEERKKETQSRFQNIDNQIKDISQNLQKKSSQINQLSEELSTTNSRFEEVEEEISETQEEVDNVKSELEDFKPAIDDALPSVTTVQLKYYSEYYGQKVTTEGSGVVVNNGDIITNRHVVDPLTGGNKPDDYSLNISFYSGETYSGEVIGWSSNHDIAVIQTSNNAPSLSFDDSDNINVGQEVVALGNPIGLDFTATKGIISKKEREVNTKYGTDYYIQTDAPINPGSSGGPLINEDGNIIGINTAGALDSEGVGFALPSNTVKEAYQNIK